MIWSAKKQYYRNLQAFSQLKTIFNVNHCCLEVVVVLARSSTGKISCLKPCGMAMQNARWRSQVFTSWCGEIKINLSVLCKKWNNIDSNSMLWGSAVVISIRVSPYYLFGNFCETMWYGSANHSGCAWNFRNDE